MHGSSKLSLPTGVCICKCPEAASNRGLQVVGQGFGDVQAFVFVQVCVFRANVSQYLVTCTGVFPPPQARLINSAVSVRSALSGVQPASQLSGKVTAAKPNRAKLSIAGSSENMETCLTPTRNYPVKGHQIIWFSPLLHHQPQATISCPLKGTIWTVGTSVCQCTFGRVFVGWSSARRIRPAHQSFLHHRLVLCRGVMYSAKSREDRGRRCRNVSRGRREGPGAV